MRFQGRGIMICIILFLGYSCRFWDVGHQQGKLDSWLHVRMSDASLMRELLQGVVCSCS